MPVEYGYKRDGETVTLTMSRDDYDELLMCLGIAIRAANEPRPALFLSRLALTNRLNIGNPGYTPYQIPNKETD